MFLYVYISVWFVGWGIVRVVCWCLCAHASVRVRLFGGLGGWGDGSISAFDLTCVLANCLDQNERSKVIDIVSNFISNMEICVVCPKNRSVLKMRNPNWRRVGVFPFSFVCLTEMYGVAFDFPFGCLVFFSPWFIWNQYSSLGVFFETFAERIFFTSVSGVEFVRTVFLVC